MKYIQAKLNSRLAAAHRAALRLLLFTLTTPSLVANAATDKWQSVVTGRELELTVLEPTTATARSNSALPVIVYLKNLAAPRVGTESDEVILRDFRAAGNLVAVLDFANATNARAPFINRDLGKLRDDFRARKILAQHKLDDAHIFLVPEGCRLKRDVLYFADTNRPLSLSTAGQ